MMMTVFTRVLVVTTCNNWAAPLSIKQACIIQSINKCQGLRLFSSVQFTSVQDGIYAFGKAHMRSTPSLKNFSNVCTPPCLSKMSPTLPLKQFQCSSDWRWPSLVLLGKIVQRFLFQRLSPPDDRWCVYVISLALCPQVVSQAVEAGSYAHYAAGLTMNCNWR